MTKGCPKVRKPKSDGKCTSKLYTLRDGCCRVKNPSCPKPRRPDSEGSCGPSRRKGRNPKGDECCYKVRSMSRGSSCPKRRRPHEGKCSTHHPHRHPNKHGVPCCYKRSGTKAKKRTCPKARRPKDGKCRRKDQFSKPNKHGEECCYVAKTVKAKEGGREVSPARIAWGSSKSKNRLRRVHRVSLKPKGAHSGVTKIRRSSRSSKSLGRLSKGKRPQIHLARPFKTKMSRKKMQEILRPISPIFEEGPLVRGVKPRKSSKSSKVHKVKRVSKHRSSSVRKLSGAKRHRARVSSPKKPKSVESFDLTEFSVEKPSSYRPSSKSKWRKGKKRAVLRGLSGYRGKGVRKVMRKMAGRRVKREEREEKALAKRSASAEAEWRAAADARSHHHVRSLRRHVVSDAGARLFLARLSV